MRKAMRSMMSEGGMVSFFRGAAVLLLLLGSFFVTTSVEAQPSDFCAPEVMHWTPSDGAVDVDPFTNVFAYLYDSPGICGVSSGIDSASIEMIVVIGDDTLDVTDELRIVMHGTVDVTWNHPSWGFPAGSHVDVCLTFADAVGNFATDCIEFDVAGIPPDCAPEFVSVAPPMGAFDVPSGHGINMVFGPRSDSCFTMCWDTTTFHGWLMVCPWGAACDTVELGPSDVEFFWGDLPNIGIEYHYPGGWPDGAEVHGGWAIADCDSHYADGNIYFHVAPDTTTPPDCDIVFYGALPMPGTMMVPLDAPITMTFGPADSSCDSFCVDTSTFEGAIHIGGIGMPPDTIFIGSGDVDFDYSAWP
ncbi:hypothetical protein J7L01_04550, partial [bacterium]|nr:hypothetical protein [bacterium]